MKKQILASLMIAIAGVASAEVLITEDFDDISEWTVDTNTNVFNTTASGGKLVTSPVDSGTVRLGQIAWVTQAYDNSSSNYTEYTTSFEMDFTDLSFIPAEFNGNNQIEIFSLWNAGNTPMSKLILSVRDYNDDYVFVMQNGIQYGHFGAAETTSFSIAELEGYSRMGIENITSFTQGAGLAWLISTDWTFTDLTTGTEIATFTSFTDSVANNTSFNPITGSTTFKLGGNYTQDQIPENGWTGDYTFDNFEVIAGIIPPPEPATLSISTDTSGSIAISWLPNLTGYTLQERPSLTASNWVDSASSSMTHPILIPITDPAMFYRVIAP